MNIFQSVGCIIAILALFGYGKNIYKLVQSDFEPPYKREIVHGIGIIPVVGVFIGYMNFEDGASQEKDLVEEKAQESK